MDAVDEEDFRKLFGYVALVGIKLSLDFLQEGLVLQDPSSILNEGLD